MNVPAAIAADGLANPNAGLNRFVVTDPTTGLKTFDATGWAATAATQPGLERSLLVERELVVGLVVERELVVGLLVERELVVGFVVERELVVGLLGRACSRPSSAADSWPQAPPIGRGYPDRGSRASPSRPLTQRKNVE